MNIFIYDHTFEGLLTCIFDAYSRKTFPDLLLMEGEPLPLFYNETFTVITDEGKAMRVWRGLEKRISCHALSAFTPRQTDLNCQKSIRKWMGSEYT